MKNYIVEFKFAWLPVFIRNRMSFNGFAKPHWVWFRTYTRVYKFHHASGQYRTYDTILGRWRVFESCQNDGGVNGEVQK